ncbi:MAG: hypothetical protein U0797_27920 [Gemmataceae bacterium]
MAGEKPDPEEYAARHPEAADEIRGVLGMFACRRPLPPRVASPPDALGDYRIVCELAARRDGGGG